MTIRIMTMVKDILGIFLIAGILFSSVNNWWVIIGIVIIAGNYSANVTK